MKNKKAIFTQTNNKKFSMKYLTKSINLVFLTTLFLLLFSCKSKKSGTDADKLGWSIENIQDYVSEHSPNRISVKDNITVRLNKTPDLILVETGSEIPSSIASISPSVDGSFMWRDPITLVFVPKTTLKSDTEYKVAINFDKLFKSHDAQQAEAVLTLATLKQNFDITEESINYDGLAAEVLSIRGSISSADFSENQVVEKMIAVSQKNNNNLKIDWEHYDGRQHIFSIKNIVRGEADSEVEIKFDGTDIDSDFKGSRKILVVKKGEFAFVDAKTPEDGERRIELIFSDPLLAKQNLQGLITIDNNVAPLNYEINSNVATIFLENTNLLEFTLTINGAVKNYKNKELGREIKQNFSFNPPLPELKALRQGVIIPETDKIWFPFQARNLKYVDISVTKIFQNNVLQFLQYNNLDNLYNSEAVGKEIYKEKIDLSTVTPTNNENRLVKYTLDLSKMISVDKAAIYNVNITFNKDYIAKYPCKEEGSNEEDHDASEGDEYGYDEEYGEEANENPCGQYFYYGNKFIRTNILATNIAIIAKSGSDNEWNVVCNNISTGEAFSGVDVELYSFQKQLISKGVTDGKGLLKLKAKEEASFIIAKSNGEYSYVNLQSNYANAVTEFDVSGKQLQTGLDAFIYGERGVYRPGDTMHISVMAMNHANNANLTPGFPVRLVLEDSRGKLQYDKVNTVNTNHIYYFPIATKSSTPTGNYKLTAHLGSEKFYKTIKVETVKPNRLKIQYDNQGSELKLFTHNMLQMESKWLHGASAEGLKAEVDVYWAEKDINFKTFKTYNFSDPARSLEVSSTRIFEGNLDQNGRSKFSIPNDANLLPSSALNATIKTRVFEKSGNYSEDYVTMTAHKYKNYVGIKIPQSQWGGNYLKSGSVQSLPIVSVDTDGKAVGNRKLSVGLYNAEWDWWYNESNYNLFKYNSQSHVGALKTFEVITNSKGEAKFDETYEPYRNYMVRICDTESGHCTGDFFYTSPWGDPPSNAGAPQLLTLSSDKDIYNVGETIKLRIPSNKNSKIIVSIERGNEVDQIIRLEGQEGSTNIDIPVTLEMNPNIYIHTSLIQPYSKNTKGLPLRMYGILPVKINDPSKMLSPMIAAPKVIEPNTSFTVKISEKNGREMAYTLAVVDEGLLDLTRFKTPDPLNHFYSKLGLGVNTWDMYNKVMNAHGEEIENLFAIGGDGDAAKLNTVKKANRFVPAVKFLGPFKLSKGGSKSHEITIKNYVGSVRIMAVAKSDVSFGNAEQACPVKKDIMVQNTLPRVLTPGDEIALGANVFVTNNKVKSVNLNLLHDQSFTSSGIKSTNINFAKEGDVLHNFYLKVNDVEGVGKIGSTANSGSIKSSEETEIEIRNPNPTKSQYKDVVIESGKTMDIAFDLFGTKGTNKAELEISNAPVFNLSSRLNYLISYPHGCVEQTTSAAFPQLYVADMISLSPKKKNQITTNISAAIQRLSLFQTSNGGFGYWPGDRTVADWATNYVGHFLLEAKSKAHYVPDGMLKKWAEHQKSRANSFNSSYDYELHTQAYRLYTLAKYGKPELGAMNRLRNTKGLDVSSAYTLAAAYAAAGKKEISNDLLKSQKVAASYINKHEYDYHTYGSDLRNKAMYAEAYIESGQQTNALSFVKSMIVDLNSNHWYNTQAVSFALMAIQKFYNDSDKNGLLGEIAYGGKKLTTINTNKKSLLQELPISQNQNQSVRVVNQSKGKMYVRLVYSGKEVVANNIVAKNNHVLMAVKYTDMQGSPIDVKQLKQGSNFKAIVALSNPGTFDSRLENLALNFVVPAGWELVNDRLSGAAQENPNIAYQDIRDDRIISYFNLYQNKPLNIEIPLIAAYQGKFYFPPVSCEAMYFNEVSAFSSSNFVNVVAATGLSKETE